MTHVYHFKYLIFFQIFNFFYFYYFKFLTCYHFKFLTSTIWIRSFLTIFPIELQSFGNNCGIICLLILISKLMQRKNCVYYNIRKSVVFKTFSSYIYIFNIYTATIAAVIYHLLIIMTTVRL